MRENDPVYYTKKKVAINMHNLTASAVSGGPYCNGNVTTRTEIYVANLIVM